MVITLDESRAPRTADARIGDDEWLSVEASEDYAEQDGATYLVWVWHWECVLSELRAEAGPFPSYGDAVSSLTSALHAVGIELRR